MELAIAVGVAAVVLGCGGGGGARPAAPGAGVASADAGAAVAAPAAWPAPPAGLATTALLAVNGGELVTYGIEGGALTRLGATTVAQVDPDDYTSRLAGEWADRDHFFVAIPPRTVLMVTAAGITAVPVPDASKFEAPRPKVDDDEGLTEGGGGDVQSLVVADGSAWWAECPWGYPYDGWQCEVWVHAQLWPTPGLAAGAPPEDARSWRWPDDPPAGFWTRTIENETALRCTPPAGAGQKAHVFRAVVDDAEEIAAFHWLSAQPARLLIVYGSPGLADVIPTRWSLHDGCAPAPLAQGTDVEPGPAGLWLARESPDPKADPVIVKLVVRRGADVLGELPVGSDVRFRPPASAATR